MLNVTQKKLRARIIEVSHMWHSSHLGSCLTAIDALWVLYSIKKPDEPFVLSNGHAGVAQYVVLESLGILPTAVLEKLFVHPDRCNKYGINVSTGSLGQGLPIAIGMALADKNKQVYCMISDGECSEGSIWESFRIIRERKMTNLTIILNANGWGAYQEIELTKLYAQIAGFGLKTVHVNGHDLSNLTQEIQKKRKEPTIIISRTKNEQLPFLKGQDAHYYVMTDSDYLLAKKIYS
ncbi:MAG: thiamine pyrophosphate-dependent enzyme [Candidatus Roizmanbacteria bacterium]|nr:thiamine pyrophosphate-dependent enzyme [Candidatus Roizmanbacteria bacterium]